MLAWTTRGFRAWPAQRGPALPGHLAHFGSALGVAVDKNERACHRARNVCDRVYGGTATNDHVLGRLRLDILGGDRDNVVHQQPHLVLGFDDARKQVRGLLVVQSAQMIPS